VIWPDDRGDITVEPILRSEGYRLAGALNMQRPKIQPLRNKLDLTDRVQVRIVTKRLRVSHDELTSLVGRVGNSISALAKEAHLQRERRLSVPANVPQAAVIAQVATTEVTSELAAAGVATA
jgi:hypothetical protein